MVKTIRDLKRKPIIGLFIKSLPAICLFVLQIHFGRTQGFELIGTTDNVGSAPIIHGSIYKTDSLGNNMEILARFPEGYGEKPAFDLCHASNGKIYGVCQGGPIFWLTSHGFTDNHGLIFEFDPSSKQFSILYQFENNNDGRFPLGIIEVSPNLLIGTTSKGGALNRGILYEFNLNTKSFTVKKEFGLSQTGSPWGEIYKASDGHYYMLCSDGGINGAGSIIRHTYSTNSLTTIAQMNKNIHGSSPDGELYEAGGRLWFFTDLGPNNMHGSLNYYDFGTNSLGVANWFNGGSEGGSPTGTVFYHAGTNRYYGLVKTGMSNGLGGIFEYNPINHSIVSAVAFDSIGIGSNPDGPLFDAGGGLWYGCNKSIAGPGNGSIYSFNPQTKQTSLLAVFSGDSLGARPNGGLIRTGANEIFGTTYSGGLGGSGTIFKFLETQNRIETEWTFEGRADGQNPVGGVIKYSEDLYLGVTSHGGKYNMGTLYSYNMESDRLSILIDFNGTNGAHPWARPLKASNGKIYGTTNIGGYANEGVVFEYDLNSGAYRLLFEFDWFVNSSEPAAGLIQHSNGKIYGLTTLSTISGGGQIFEFDPVLDTFKITLELPWTVFASHGRMIELPNGKLYGLSVAGGFSAYGSLFEFNPQNNTVSVLHHFAIGPGGSYPYGGLLYASDGNLYGTTSEGGNGTSGTIFRYDLSKDSLSTLYDFEWPLDGIRPFCTLQEGLPGKLYGGTTEGGINNNGKFFEYDFIRDTLVYKFDFGDHGMSNFFLTDQLYRDIICIPNGSNQFIDVCDSFISATGKVYFESGIFQDTLLNSFGCDSIVTTNLTLRKNNLSQLESACDSFFWAQTAETFYISGNYFDTLVNSLGCDSIIELNLDLSFSNFGYDTIQACDSFYWQSSDITYYTSGNFQSLLSNSKGCDSMANIALEIHYSDSSIQNIQACDSFFWDATSSYYSIDGTYSASLNTIEGCDSSLVLNLDIGNNSGFDSIFNCESYFWPSSNIRYYQSGVYQEILTNAQGCDSIATLFLEIGRDSTLITTTACDSFLWDQTGSYYFTSEILSDTVIDVQGCDSIIYIDLSILNSSIGNTILSSCDSFFWDVNNQYYDSSGVYSGLLTNSVGCDSFTTLDLTINRAITSNQPLVTACDSAQIGNQWYYSSQTVTEYFPNGSGLGCDSTSITPISISNSIEFNAPPVIGCDSIFYDSTWYFSSQIITKVFSGGASNGCDSSVVTNLIIHPTSMEVANVTACDSFLWDANGQVYYTSGSYLETLQNRNGCDSIVNLQLSVNNSSSGQESVNSCDQYFWNATSQTYTSSGIFSALLQNSMGCDSTATLNLTILNSSTRNLTFVSCDSILSPSGNYVWTSTGLYSDTIQNNNGCDSILVCDVTISSIDTSINLIGDSLFANHQGFNYQWIDCGNNQAIPGETNSWFVPTKSGSYSLAIFDGNCSDTSSCIFVDILGLNIQSKPLHVFPNPTSGELIIGGSEGLNITLLLVYNSNGVEVIRKQTFPENGKLDVSELVPGTYFLLIKVQEDEFRFNFIKE